MLHCEQDIDHGAWMTETLQKLATSEQDREQVRRGARLSLDARYHLWTGIERRVVASRQPVGLEAVEKGLIGKSRARAAVKSPGKLPELRRRLDIELANLVK